MKFAQQYIGLSFDCLIFHSVSPDPGAFLQAYGHNVLPRLRAKESTR